MLALLIIYSEVSLIGKAVLCFFIQYYTSMNDNKIRGLTTELQCQLFFTSLGYNVSIPLGEDCKYDMIVDIKTQLLRVQVKSASLAPSGICFSTTSTYLTSNGAKISKYSEEDIDFFATFWESQCYLIPVKECQGKERTLRFFNQRCNDTAIYLLEDFEAKKIISLLQEKQKLPSGRRIIVQQFDLNNNLLNTFSSYADAAVAINKPSGAPHISECARGLRNTAYGFIWKNTEEM